MADATTIKSSKVRVLLDTARNGTFTTKCGFTQNAITFGSGMETFIIPSCDDPDKVSWEGKDKVSLNINVTGEGVVAVESTEDMLDMQQDPDSFPAKIEIEFPAKTLTYTGKLHVESVELGRQDGRRVTMNAAMPSDGEFVKTTTP